MKDFKKIDWKIYNKPPYLQQWLCKDDTLELAEFGDKRLEELDNHILSLVNQWNLGDSENEENVSGHLLDRIGKLFGEKRNGSPDEFYRILINLRKLLNTNRGSIPDIIKAIKYFYKSEVVHIVPVYPAGLTIKHDGEGTPGLNFNKLIAEIIPAGVSFSTTELFNFIEDLFSVDEQFIHTLRHSVTENYFNSQNNHDKSIQHNGQFIHHSSGYYEKNKMDFSMGEMSDEILINEEINDELTAGIVAHYFHNGVYLRNETIKHKGGFFPLDIV